MGREVMRVNTSVGRSSIVERLADECTSGSHQGCSSYDGETGKLQKRNRTRPNAHRKRNALPIRSHPHP